MGVGPDGAGGGEGGLFVGGVGVGMEEDDAKGFGALGEEVAGGVLDFVGVDGVKDGAVGVGAFADFEAEVAVDGGDEGAGEAPGLAAVAAAHFEDVAEAFCGDEAGAGAFAFEEGVGAVGGAVDDGAASGQGGEGCDAGGEPVGFAAAGAGDFADFGLSARLVIQKQIGVGATNVNANDQLGHEYSFQAVIKVFCFFFSKKKRFLFLKKKKQKNFIRSRFNRCSRASHRVRWPRDRGRRGFPSRRRRGFRGGFSGLRRV